VLPAQVVVGPGGRVGEDLRDLVQTEFQLPVEQHLVKPAQVGLRVQPVATRAARAGRQQPDAVIVVQRAHRDVRQAGHLADRVTIHGSTVQPDAA
jgi:hypothetical protein